MNFLLPYDSATSKTGILHESPLNVMQSENKAFAPAVPGMVTNKPIINPNQPAKMVALTGTDLRVNIFDISVHNK